MSDWLERVYELRREIERGEIPIEDAAALSLAVLALSQAVREKLAEFERALRAVNGDHGFHSVRADRIEDYS